jgi:hypothetical protein
MLRNLNIQVPDSFPVEDLEGLALDDPRLAFHLQNALPIEVKIRDDLDSTFMSVKEKAAGYLTAAAHGLGLELEQCFNQGAQAWDNDYLIKAEKVLKWLIEAREHYHVQDYQRLANSLLKAFGYLRDLEKAGRELKKGKGEAIVSYKDVHLAE